MGKHSEVQLRFANQGMDAQCRVVAGVDRWGYGQHVKRCGNKIASVV